MRCLRFQRVAGVTPVLIAGLSLLGAALSPHVARAQNLYVSSSRPAGQFGTDTIQVFNGTTGASQGALALGETFSGLAFGPDVICTPTALAATQPSTRPPAPSSGNTTLPAAWDVILRLGRTATFM